MAGGGAASRRRRSGNLSVYRQPGAADDADAQGRIRDLDRYAAAAQGAARRAAALTHRLLALSRHQTLEPKAVDVNRLVAGMEELVRRTVGPQVTVKVVAASGLWATMADPN